MCAYNVIVFLTEMPQSEHSANMHPAPSPQSPLVSLLHVSTV